MPYIRFLVDYTVKKAGGESFKAGQILECTASRAEHFKRRQAAVDCEPPERIDVPKVTRPVKKATIPDGTTD